MKSKKIVILAAALVVVLVVAIVMGSCIKSVPTGYTGILTTFGRVENANLDAGIHVIAPWQKIVLMDNRVQKETVLTEAFSSDIQQVDVTLTITYSIDKQSAAKLYSNVGTHYYDVVVYPRLMENTKAVFANYSAEGLVEQRGQLASQITDLMSEDLTGYGITTAGVAIENIDFTDAFTDAIEAKQVATQEKQRAQTQQEQATMEATAAAQRQKIAAEAEAEVARIQADAEAYSITAKASAEADANSQIAASLTDKLIDYLQVQQWNGEMPRTVVGGENSLPIINMND